MPKGIGSHRVQVLLPEEILGKFLLDAQKNLRSESAQAATILIRHYERQAEEEAES
jgi:hypothetical protein